jgi:hypothetical protein
MVVVVVVSVIEILVSPKLSPPSWIDSYPRASVWNYVAGTSTVWNLFFVIEERLVRTREGKKEKQRETRFLFLIRPLSTN